MFGANNYGYNPYGRYITPQQPLQQPLQTTAELQRPILNGKQVESVDVVKAMDIPLDGSISYFPITDGSAIVTKQLQNDGTSRTIIYKPVKEDNTQKYLTNEDINSLEEDIKELKTQIKDIKNNLKDKEK